MVAPGGYLLYSTCTYSKKENEAVIDWALKKFPHFSACEVDALKDYQSAHSSNFCYRLFPHESIGAGAFTCLLKNNQSDTTSPRFDVEDLYVQWKSSDWI